MDLSWQRTDKDGWVYGTHFAGAVHTHRCNNRCFVGAGACHPEDRIIDSVRRRKWARRMTVR